MSKISIRISTLLLLCAMLFPLSACGDELPSANSVMTQFCARYPHLPAGRTYRLSAQEYEEEVLRPTFAAALYGNDLSFLADAAVYFCAATDVPGEMGIFICRTGDDAERMATLCLARLYHLRKAAPAAESLMGSKVLRFGHTVVYTALPDNAAAERILRSIL